MYICVNYVWKYCWRMSIMIVLGKRRGRRGQDEMYEPERVTVDSHRLDQRNYHQDRIKRFVCPNCYRRYTQKKGLSDHLRFSCGKPPSSACPYCPYRSSYAFNVTKHIRRKHPANNVEVIQLYAFWFIFIFYARIKKKQFFSSNAPWILFLI